MWIWKDTGEQVSERQLFDEIYECLNNDFDDEKYEEYLNDMEPDVEIFGVKYGKGSILRKIDPLMFEMMRQETVQFYAEENTYDLEPYNLMDEDEPCNVLGLDIPNIVWKEEPEDDD